MNRNGRYMEELMYVSDTNRSKTQANTEKPRHEKKMKMIESLNIRKNNQNSYDEHDDGDYKENEQKRTLYGRINVSFGHKSKQDTNDSPSRNHKRIDCTKVLGLRRNYRHERPTQII